MNVSLIISTVFQDVTKQEVHVHTFIHSPSHAFRSIRQSASFQSYCSSLLSVLALGPTVDLGVYFCLDLGPETGTLQHVLD